MEWILHFSRITERVVDIKSPLYRGSNAPLEQPEEEEEEEEEEERERNVCGRARAREAGESRRGALLRASEARVCRHHQNLNWRFNDAYVSSQRKGRILRRNARRR